MPGRTEALRGGEQKCCRGERKSKKENRTAGRDTIGILKESDQWRPWVVGVSYDLCLSLLAPEVVKWKGGHV